MQKNLRLWGRQVPLTDRMGSMAGLCLPGSAVGRVGRCLPRWVNGDRSSQPMQTRLRGRWPGKRGGESEVVRRVQLRGKRRVRSMRTRRGT